jgi:hypothetical protein
MARKAARSILGVQDMKARFAEVFFEHPGKTGIVFDQENAFVHEPLDQFCPILLRHKLRRVGKIAGHDLTAWATARCDFAHAV